MPDWITHIAVARILCTVLSFRYKEFTPANTAIVLVGALIPDIIKLGLVGQYFGFNFNEIITPIHIPIGSFIIAGMFSLLFSDRKMVFLFLSFGVITHYALDLLLVGQGMYLFFPFYWGQYQLELVPTDSFYITIVALALAMVVYLILQIKKRSIKDYNNN